MSDYRYIPPQEWLESLDGETRARADRLIALLTRFQARNPAGWVASDMRDDIPQVARFFFLHGLRQYVRNGKYFVPGEGNKSGTYYPFDLFSDASPDDHLSSPARIEAGTAAFHRLIEAGVDREELVRIAHAAIAMSVDALIEYLDHSAEFEWDDIPDAPGWSLREDGTGRVLGGLHESFGNLYETDT